MTDGIKHGQMRKPDIEGSEKYSENKTAFILFVLLFCLIFLINNK